MSTEIACVVDKGSGSVDTGVEETSEKRGFTREERRPANEERYRAWAVANFNLISFEALLGLFGGPEAHRIKAEHEAMSTKEDGKSTELEPESTNVQVNVESVDTGAEKVDSGPIIVDKPAEPVDRKTYQREWTRKKREDRRKKQKEGG